ncbi:MAG: hypothetical protein FWB72_07285 [Firmicutes bacterium]|nr:hypothetical protein [Bacillota bacterium]
MKSKLRLILIFGLIILTVIKLVACADNGKNYSNLPDITLRNGVFVATEKGRLAEIDFEVLVWKKEFENIFEQQNRTVENALNFINSEVHIIYAGQPAVRVVGDFENVEDVFDAFRKYLIYNWSDIVSFIVINDGTFFWRERFVNFAFGTILIEKENYFAVAWDGETFYMKNITVKNDVITLTITQNFDGVTIFEEPFVITYKLDADIPIVYREPPTNIAINGYTLSWDVTYNCWTEFWESGNVIGWFVNWKVCGSFDGAEWLKIAGLGFWAYTKDEKGFSVSVDLAALDNSEQLQSGKMYLRITSGGNIPIYKFDESGKEILLRFYLYSEHFKSVYI